MQGSPSKRVSTMPIWLASWCASFPLPSCAPVSMSFGEMDQPAVANVYVEQTTPGLPLLELGSLCADTQTTVTTSHHPAASDATYEVVWVTGKDSLVLRVLHAGQVLDEHVYDQGFLDSGRFDRVEVTLPNGEQYTYTIWGASLCEQCPPHAPGGDQVCFPKTHTKPATAPSRTGVVVGTSD